jgi:hypothetical protein
LRAHCSIRASVSLAIFGGEGKTLEADGTYVGRKPGMKVTQGGKYTIPVLTLVERDGTHAEYHGG